MERKKGYLIVIVAAAALTLLLVGLVFNAASLQKQNINLSNQVAYAAEKLSAKEDLMIYWVGEFPPEMAGIENVVTVIPAAQINEENMPIKSSTFKSTEYDEFGNVIKEIIPREYKDNMIIVLYNVSIVTDEQKEVILNCVAQNSVPVLAIGRSSIALIRELLMYTPGDFAEYDSFYYRLGEGYKDHVLDNESMEAGGEKFALNLMDYLYGLFYPYTPDTPAPSNGI